MTASVGASAGSALAGFRRGWGRLGHALEHPAVMPGIAVAGAVFVVAMVSFALRGDPLIGYDAHAYYQAAALDDPYRATINGGFDAVGGLYEYKYPPPLAQVLHPLRMLGISWPAFLGAWTALLLVSLGFMGRRWTLLLLLFPPVLGELWLGNLNILLGLAIVLGMRWPASWAFILLTKITPGIGLIWFAARREWRNLAIALVATVVVVGVSYVLAPWLWADFIEASKTQVDATVNVPRQAAPVALPLRLAVAAVLVVLGRADGPGVDRADRRRARRAVPVVERLCRDGRGRAAVRVASRSAPDRPDARHRRAGPCPDRLTEPLHAPEPGPAVAGHRDRPARAHRAAGAAAGGRSRLPGPGGRRDPAHGRAPGRRHVDLHRGRPAVDGPAVAGPGAAGARVRRRWLGAARRRACRAGRARPRLLDRRVDGPRRRAADGRDPRAAGVRARRPGARAPAAAVRDRDLRRAPVADRDAHRPSAVAVGGAAAGRAVGEHPRLVRARAARARVRMARRRRPGSARSARRSRCSLWGFSRRS